MESNNSSSSSSSSDQKFRQYHPYQDLNVPIKTLYNLPTSPEFLFQEESLAQRRSWGENLQYYTGSGYLLGAVLGAAKGTAEGVRAAEAGDSAKLRVNRVLNCGGQSGRRVGNSLGVMGLIFAGLESGVTHLRGGSDDVLSSVLAGLGTGAIYKAAAGPRSRRLRAPLEGWRPGRRSRGSRR
ncbi:hypothetical protein Syun_016094 [Stephania yunnanensis]|uniref:Mitochondrial import inner membrane translocase subunit TIM23 n=1 Tax=Stephania yunnanensis TaxID=152371 RepID=A0AAP0P120_9MAGN